MALWYIVIWVVCGIPAFFLIWLSRRWSGTQWTTIHYIAWALACLLFGPYMLYTCLRWWHNQYK